MNDRHPHAGEEIADTLIVLMSVAHTQGFDLLGRARRILADWHTGREEARFASQSNLHTSAAVIGCLAAAIRSDAHSGSAFAAANLLGLAARLGVDVQAEIDAKMAVNRARVWKLDGSDHGYYVRDKGAA